MKLKPYVCSLLLALGLSSVAYADTTTPPPLPPEMQQQLLDAQKKALEAELKLSAEKEKNIEEKHKLFVENEENLKKHQDRMFLFTTVGTIGGIIIGWLSFILMAQKWVREWVEKEINGNLKHLTRIVDNSRLETRLKESTRLLVLHQRSITNNLHSELRNTGFLVVESMPCLDPTQDINWKEYDQVIFDSVEEQTLLTYVEKYPHRMFLAYTVGHYPNLPRNGMVATANSKMTLYSRLMESLTWQHWQKNKAT